MHFCFCRCSFFISFNTTCGKTVVAIFDISTPEGGEGGGGLVCATWVHLIYGYNQAQ